MTEYILFMHDDAVDRDAAGDGARWASYLAGLRQSGQFDGGSSIGQGMCLNKDGGDRPAAVTPTGYLRVRASSFEEARRFVEGNPVYEAGGTVELRELVRDD